VYSGSVDVLPDLVVDWDPTAPCANVGSPRIGVVRKQRGGIRAGEHRAPGMLFARGPEIAPGPLDAEVQAVDVAPTLMAMLGVTAQDLDGEVVAPLVCQNGMGSGNASSTSDR